MTLHNAVIEIASRAWTDIFDLRNGDWKMITPDMKQSGDNDVNIYLIGGDPGRGGMCTCFFERLNIWVFKWVWRKAELGKLEERRQKKWRYRELEDVKFTKKASQSWRLWNWYTMVPQYLWRVRSSLLAHMHLMIFPSVQGVRILTPCSVIGSILLSKISYKK